MACQTASDCCSRCAFGWVLLSLWSVIKTDLISAWHRRRLNDPFWTRRQTSSLIWKKIHDGHQPTLPSLQNAKMSNYWHVQFYFIIIFFIPHGLQNLPFKFSTDWRGFNIILAVLLARPRVFSLIISCTDWKLTVNVRHALLPNNSWHGKKFDLIADGALIINLYCHRTAWHPWHSE